MPSNACGKCGGKTVAAGALQGLQRVSFRPEGTKFFTLETGDVMTKAMMCRDCGAIEIVGDTSKLKRLISGVPETVGVID